MLSHSWGSNVQVLRLHPGSMSWVVSSTVKGLDSWYVSAAAGGPTPDPRCFGPLPVMDHWQCGLCGLGFALGVETQALFDMFVLFVSTFSRKIEAPRRFLEPSKGEHGRNGPWNGRQNESVTCQCRPQTRFWAYTRASLRPRIPTVQYSRQYLKACSKGVSAGAGPMIDDQSALPIST